MNNAPTVNEIAACCFGPDDRRADGSFIRSRYLDTNQGSARAAKRGRKHANRMSCRVPSSTEARAAFLAARAHPMAKFYGQLAFQIREARRAAKA
jgi:hypothetical protein